MSVFLWFGIPFCWLLLASITGLVAEHRGYDFHEYYWLALLLPIISLLLLFAPRPAPQSKPVELGPTCPACGEPRLDGATLCSMCGREPVE